MSKQEHPLAQYSYEIRKWTNEAARLAHRTRKRRLLQRIVRSALWMMFTTFVIIPSMIAGGFLFGVIPNDFVQGITKPIVFGAIISITVCYFGLRTTGGTEGVGESTTKTVVTASILILVSDYFLTQIMLSVLHVP